MFQRRGKFKRSGSRHKRPAKLARVSSSDWEIISNSITDAALVLDLNHKILAANPAAVRVIGLTEEQLVGRHSYSVFHGLSRPPEVCPHDEKLRKSIPPEKIEMVEMINLLQRSEEKYRTLFEESGEVIFIVSSERKLTDINPAGVELLGYSSKQELLEADIGRDLLLDPENEQAFWKIMREKGCVRDFEVVLKRKDGREVVGNATADAVRDDKGNIAAYRGIMRDITEQKRLQRQLFQAQKMGNIGTLAGGIAHDFNNLLGGILGYASFMKTKIEEHDPFYRYIDTIEKSATKAAQLTKWLLGFARGGKHDTKPIDINSVVDETINIISRTLGKAIEIKACLQRPLPTIEADPAQLQNALMNLCVNARDAMEGKGELSIRTEVETVTKDFVKTHMGAREGSYVTLSVTDTGVGMDEETQKKIFEPFFTTKEEGKGTGLGLSMVHAIVKNHGGFMLIYSQPDRGTTFNIYLPVSGKPEAQGASAVKAPRGGNELVLVVDDDESIRALAKETLETFGYRVLSAENGKEAISAYERHKSEIDLVILDMDMPKMGGHETFSKLKEINPKVRALLSTGYGQNEKTQGILDSGVRGFIQKPYRIDAMLSKMRNVLDAKE